MIRFLPFLFLFISCKTAYVYQKPPEVSHAKDLQDKKVTLIGFCPYTVSSSSRVSGRVRTTTTTAVLAVNHCVKNKFEFGTPIEQQTYTGTRNDISEQATKDFLKEYLNDTKGAGVNELAPMLKEENKKILLRKSDTDYYVMGITESPFGSKQTPLGFLFSLITIIPSLGTLGTIPTISQSENTIKIKLYDKNFKFLKQYIYDNRTFWTISSWWSENTEPELIPSKLSHPKGSFTLAVKEFTNDFYRDLSDNSLKSPQ